jgi:hypothetical protein
VVNYDLSATDERDDFQPVAILKQRISMPRAGDDFQIELDGDVRLRYAQVAKQPGDARAGLNIARLAVNLNRHP